MDDLQIALRALPVAEKKEFERYLQLRRNKEDRKDIDLYEKLINEEEVDKKSKKESDRINQNRMRLWNSLAEYTVINEMHDESTPVAKLVSYVSLSRYLFKNRLQKSGWKFLSKAEKLAEDSQHYFILKSIYLLKLENSHYGFADDIAELLKKIKENNKRLEKNEKLLVASNYVKHYLNHDKTKPGKFSLKDKVDGALKKFKLNISDFESPSQVHSFLTIIRNSYLVTQELNHFQGLIIEQYHRLMKTKKFDSYTHYYKLDILYMIAHACFRNRDFIQAKRYLEELNDNLMRHSNEYFTRYYPKYLAMLSNILSLTGENDKAIELTEKILKDKKLKMSLKDNYNLNLNLVVFNFYKRKFKVANRFFLFVPHSDETLIKKLGAEWVMRKNLIHAILQYELGNEDVCLSIISKMEKRFNETLQSDNYKRVREYLSFLKKYIHNPTVFNKIDFYQDAEHTLYTKEFDAEEYKTMAFYGWLKSKAEKKDFYEVMLGMIGKK